MIQAILSQPSLSQPSKFLRCVTSPTLLSPNGEDHEPGAPHDHHGPARLRHGASCLPSPCLLPAFPLRASFPPSLRDSLHPPFLPPLLPFPLPAFPAHSCYLFPCSLLAPLGIQPAACCPATCTAPCVCFASSSEATDFCRSSSLHLVLRLCSEEGSVSFRPAHFSPAPLLSLVEQGRKVGIDLPSPTFPQPPSRLP